MEYFINSILERMTSVAKPQKKFLVTLFLTILLMRGKVNFRNLSRYSELNEKTYLRQFRQSFDFVALNEQLIEDVIPSHHEKIGVSGTKGNKAGLSNANAASASNSHNFTT